MSKVGAAVRSPRVSDLVAAARPDVFAQTLRRARDRAIVGRRYRARMARYERGQERAAAWISQQYGDVVAGGPFASMAYPAPAAIDGALPSKLLGLYERELADVVERVIAAAPRRVVDVGCASGYYLVGLARRLPDAELWGFDTDAGVAEVAAETARRNGVADRVHVEARACEPAELDRLAGPDTLVFVDIEGAEDDLVDPGRVPSLRSATVVVELHDFLRPGVSSRVAARFGATHQVEFVHAEPLRNVVHPAIVALPRPLRRWVDEMRPDGMRWALFTPR